MPWWLAGLLVFAGYSAAGGFTMAWWGVANLVHRGDILNLDKDPTPPSTAHLVSLGCLPVLLVVAGVALVRRPEVAARWLATGVFAWMAMGAALFLGEALGI